MYVRKIYFCQILSGACCAVLERIAPALQAIQGVKETPTKNFSFANN